MKTVLIVAGIILILAMGFVAYACVVVGSRAERQLYGDDWEG